MVFTKEITSFIQNNLSDKPAELRAKIAQNFGNEFTYQQVADKLKEQRKRSNTFYGTTTPTSSRTIAQDVNGTTSTNVPVASTNLSPTSLLTAHGLNPKEFDLVRVWYKEKENGGYLSSIFAKPKFKGTNLTDVINELKKDVTPTNIQLSSKKGVFNFLINLADIHFGVSKLHDVEQSLININNFFAHRNNPLGKVYINLLGDEFHSSQVDESITLSGTRLDEVNMVSAIHDAQEFYATLFSILDKKASKIILYRTPGNHDGNISYLFTEYLKAKYPKVEINNTNAPRTYYAVDNIGIMLTHGHLGKRQEYINMFASEGQRVFSDTWTHIILTGHRHFEYVEQNSAATIYQVGTDKPTEKWSNSQGYVKDKRTRNWQIMKLDETEIVSINYI
jgi:hypothetical protein